MFCKDDSSRMKNSLAFRRLLLIAKSLSPVIFYLSLECQFLDSSSYLICLCQRDVVLSMELSVL